MTGMSEPNTHAYPLVEQQPLGLKILDMEKMREIIESLLLIGSNITYARGDGLRARCDTAPLVTLSCLE